MPACVCVHACAQGLAPLPCLLACVPVYSCLQVRVCRFVCACVRVFVHVCVHCEYVLCVWHVWVCIRMCKCRFVSACGMCGCVYTGMCVGLCLWCARGCVHVHVSVQDRVCMWHACGVCTCVCMCSIVCVACVWVCLHTLVCRVVCACMHRAGHQQRHSARPAAGCLPRHSESAHRQGSCAQKFVYSRRPDGAPLLWGRLFI